MFIQVGDFVYLQWRSFETAHHSGNRVSACSNMRNIAWTLSSSSWVVIMFVSLVLSTSPPHLVQCVRAGDSLRMLNAILESKTSAKELFTVAQPAVAGMKAGAAPVTAVILVDQGGLGDYKTVGEAIAAIPIHNKDPVIIYVHAGVYE